MLKNLALVVGVHALVDFVNDPEWHLEGVGGGGAVGFRKLKGQRNAPGCLF